MRSALWFIALFGVASAVALFASSNGSTVTIYWPPYRVDLSLNLVVLVLLAGFVLVHLALRTLALLTALPARARDWRAGRHERAMQVDFLDGLVYLMTGRYSRARKAAEQTLLREASLRALGRASDASARMQVMAHLMAAQSAQALQDVAARDRHVSQALELADSEEVGGSQEAVKLRAAHWALQERDLSAAQRWLDQLPGGVARRTLALRLRLRLARLMRHGPQALETTRLLAKHKAFSALQARSLLRALVVESVSRCSDADELAKLWSSLDAGERDLPEVACQAAAQLVRLQGEASLALRWLTPVWQRMADHEQGLQPEQQQQLIHALECAFDAGACSPDWLARIEGAHKQWPADAALQYLAGVACWHAQLWGKSQQAIEQALPRLQHAYLQARAWYILADLAHRRGQSSEAVEAWRKALSLMLQAQRPAMAPSEAEPL
jgi:HemY protein